MNHIFRSIWNEKVGTFVAVSELAKSCGKKASAGKVAGVGLTLKTLGASLLLALGSPLYALPTDGVVTAGSATISSSAGSMTINQTSQNAALNWQSFSIGQGEAVQFVQPGSSSVALNRVLGADPSSILGSLAANGQVFLINPNGIVFGQGASVNVGGLVASTLNISDTDFMAGEYKFAGTSAAAVLNQGHINADGGFVALLGANVSNQGVIAARLGTVALAAGEAITLDVVGDGLLNVGIDQGAVNALVANGGLIQADGGQVLMTAQAAGHLLNTVVNNTGLVQAQTIENRDGVIRLLGDMQTGTVNVAGTLDASAPTGGDGGFIDTSAATVTVADDTRVTTAAAQGLTGSWLIDPTDYTIAASGGDITGAVLSDNLVTTNVIIESISGETSGAGDINVNDTVSWSANKLTLNAQNDININTAMYGSGTASLALEYGQAAVALDNTSTVIVNAPVNLPAGESFSRKLGSDGATVSYTVITSLGAAGSVTGTDLQGMNGNLDGNFVLGANIDAGATSDWNDGAGFSPIVGSEEVTLWEDYTHTVPLPFNGIFDGLGHTISGLTINRPTVSNVGMFGLTGSTAVIRNIGLTGGSVTGARYTSALVAKNHGRIHDSYATGSVTATDDNSLYVGGLVGGNFGSISDSYAAGAVTGQRSVGGLVGTNGTAGNPPELGSIIRSHATGAVTAGTYNSGGLAGNNEANSSIVDSYATGAVSGGKNGSGGLVGSNNGSISTSYATGAATNLESFVGGLVGVNSIGTITLSYSTGAVSGSGNSIGGLVGASCCGHVSNSYWNTDTSGRATSAGGTGLTSVQMQTASNFAGFNFTTTPGATGNNWVMVNVDGTLNNADGALGATRPMLASEYSMIINNAHQLQLMSMDPTASYTLGQNIDAAATGTANDVWSDSTFIPVGILSARFSGSFDGQGRTISNLTVNRPDNDRVGLFGHASANSSINNVGLVGVTVTGHRWVGGLVGVHSNGSISNSYVTGAVAGDNQVGGLVGYGAHSSISNSYATSAVTGNSFVGGLMGYGEHASISNSYASGTVMGDTRVGGLIGLNEASSISNSFWNTDTFTQTASADGLGMTTEQMQTQANFTSATAANGNVDPDWDFADTWVQYDTHTHPLLRSFMTAITVTANDTNKTYDGSAFSGSDGVTYSATPDGRLLGSVSYGGGAQGAVNAGSYAITASGLYSTDQQGYAITYVDGALTVDPVALSLSGSRAYDGTTNLDAGALTITGLVGSETLSLTGSGTVVDKHVANGKTVTLGSLALVDGTNGGVASNYSFNGGTQTADITEAALTLSTSDVVKTYDGGTLAAGTATVTDGILFSGDTLAGGSFAFTDPNVGEGNKTVTASDVTVTDGNSGGNYIVTYADNTTSTISPYAVSLTGSRVYDGTADIAADDLAIGSLVGSETLILSGSGAVADKHVANDKTVTLGSLALADGENGGLASNYSFNGGTQTTDITQAALTLSTSDVSKTYDGGTLAAGTATVADGMLFGGDTLSGGSFAFTNPNVGDGNKTVTTSDVTLTDGNSGGNYNVAYADNVTSTISPYAVTLTGSRVYDGTTGVAAAALMIGNLVGIETLSLSGSGSVVDKHVANGKTVTLGSLALADGNNGGLASNYSFNGGTQTADITRAALTLSTGDVSKTFDGTTTAAGTATVTAGTLFDTDALSGGSFAFTDPSVGVGVGNKVVTTNDVTVTDGNNGGNYSISYADNTTSTITEAQSAPSVPPDTRLESARATAISSDAVANQVSSASTRQLPLPASGGSAASTLAGLDIVIVSDGIRLAPGMQPGDTPVDDAN